MKYLNLFFHIYQPPFQDATVIQKIVDECYLPLTRQIAAFRDLKFTLNINFSLTEHLDHIAPEVLRNIREANKNGQLELTESGAYHPIFPLIPQAEVETQLRLNRAGNQRLLVPAFAPQGIFPPEMAFEPRLVTVFKRLGYKWTIADDFSLSHYGIDTPYDKIYSCEDMAVFLRSNFWSNKFARYQPGQWRSGKDFVQELITGMNQWMGEKDGYLIIALEGETFGHHHPTLGEAFLHEMFQAFMDLQAEIQLTHLSDLYGRFNFEPQFIPPSSWSMDEVNIRGRDYFTLWKSPGNPIHRLQWDFTHYVLDKVRSISSNDDVNAEMNKAIFSCQYWWASFWKFSPAMIYQGAFNMMRLLQRIGGKLGYDHIEEGEKIFRELVIEVEKRDLRGTTHA